MRFGLSSTTLALVLPPAPNREGGTTQGSNPGARLQWERPCSTPKCGRQGYLESSTTPNTLKGAGRGPGRGWPVLTQPQHPQPAGPVLQPLPLVDGPVLVVHPSPAAPLPAAPLALVVLPAGVKRHPVALDAAQRWLVRSLLC